MLLEKMDLQLFAEEAAEEVEEVEDQETQPEEKEIEVKTFTQEEVDKIISDRLSRERGRQEKELREAIEKEQQEAKRLAELTAEERAREEKAKTEEELEAARNELRRYKLEQDVMNILQDEGLDAAFKDFLIAKDEETTNNNIKKFKEIYSRDLDARVTEKLKGNTQYRAANLPGGRTDKLSIDELAKQASIRK